MHQEKGNILIVVVLLAIAGFILFSQVTQFFGKEVEKTKTESSISQPISEEESVVSPPQKEPEKPKETEGAREPDTLPPILSNPQPTGGLPFQTRETYLSVETDEKATCRYSDISGVYYEYMQNEFSTEDGFLHRALITTLSEGESYEYCVRCMDEEGNKNTEDLVISFWVERPEDFTPPKRTNFYPTGDTLPIGTKSTMIGVSTDEAASCRYDRRPGVDYDSMRNRLSPDDYNRYHTAVISGLEDGQAYGFYVRCKDLAGNKNTGDVLIYFQVGL
ncbi:MAG: hypothetical protein DRZ76_00730 [Candidatus Nealsonbacteria bacterium]|nr:MAG: hypothetical protein DRZ76_00730 [Candidatus Nealsonbacteria bacterium]